MALKARSRISSRHSMFIQSDDIYLDISSTSWMEVAREPLGRKIREPAASNKLVDECRNQLALTRKTEELSQKAAQLETNVVLHRTNNGSRGHALWAS
ncbi:hypothetical protein [Microvirga massiliensis]|uniref:hypothetical protein n=1 Tax=Microvirga massiliensis TaxID=1033741 RepID=UPI00062B4941|nr:hypothetical protein [Microvirga massiliensis]